MRARARLGWVPGVLALFVTVVGLVVVACNGTPGFKPTSSGPTSANGDGGDGCIGSTCPAACAQHEIPGCACAAEGDRMSCGKIDATYPGEGSSPGVTVCGQGYSTCSNGVWGQCEITGPVTVRHVPHFGTFPQNLNPPAACVTIAPDGGVIPNYCDPQCMDFNDTPLGVDAGTAIASSDGGLSLAGDAGVCTPKGCAEQGFSCGTQGDTCGNVIQCGSCIFPATCGGGGVPNTCGVAVNCTNLCLKQVACDSGTSSISGTVYMPNGTTPLPNVLVYVPNANPSPFSQQVACVTAGNCTAEVTGSPLVATTSAIDGTFTLDNVPVGSNIPVVMQLGRFRRYFTMTTAACTNTPVPCTSAQSCLSRFPQRQYETSPYDNIPKMAFVTGKVDALECVWAKVGIATTGATGCSSNTVGGASCNSTTSPFQNGEFSPGNTDGRINLYADEIGWGAAIGDAGSATPWAPALLGSPSLLSEYDMLLFPCPGEEGNYGSATGSYPPGQVKMETNVANFANSGGRVFATHYSYIWLFTSGTTYTSPLNAGINWDVNASYTGWSDPAMGVINTSFPGGSVLANWLVVPAVGASPALGLMPINTLRHDFSGVPSTSQLYVSVNQCETTTSDANNCGACGNVCGGGKLCENGVCVTASNCPNGTTKCGSSCVNENTDVNNCGGCSNQCVSGSTCVNGTCTCGAGTTACSGACVVLSQNPSHCGACGTACNYDQTCVNGTCTCPAGYTTECTDSGHHLCVNTTSDPYNCGGCNVACGKGQSCVSGACTCQTGWTLYNGTCVNLQTDAANCGTAGHSCGAGNTCTAGVCSTCPPGYTNCSGTCLELTANPTHCSASANCSAAACPSSGNKYCSNGACSASCGSGLTNCSNACVNEQTDAQHCGGCSTVCGVGEICSGGACTCATGTTLCSGACKNTTVDPNNCGACGTKCAVGQQCTNSACVNITCGAGLNYCFDGVAGGCVNLQSDPDNCSACGQACLAGYVCTNGTCVAPALASTASDPANCGAPGVTCSAGQTCVNGVCTCASSATSCSFPMQGSFNVPLTSSASEQCGRVVFSDFHVENATDTQTSFPNECPAGGFTAQEFMLAQALFDLAGCVNISNMTPPCVPVTCGYLGLDCGTAGDGCGGTLDCGGCTAPASCGGSGIPGVCGQPLKYSPAPFIRDYNATGVCTNGQVPVWRLYTWASSTLSGSNITFSIATATSEAGLATATVFPLGWSSDPPYPGSGVPAGLTAGNPASAHQAGYPAGSPDTENWNASPDATLLANAQPQNNLYLRVIATFNPSSNLLVSPILQSWNMWIDCVDNN